MVQLVERGVAGAAADQREMLEFVLVDGDAPMASVAPGFSHSCMY